MTVKALEKRVYKLSREIAYLRSFVVEVIRNQDEEGEYKQSFVKSVLKSAKNKAVFEYSGRGSLLRQIQGA